MVALSSGEAELLSSASSICDALLIRELLEFMDFGRVKIFHHIDASAAKAMLERSGVGKVRHLSCRILWCQQLIKSGEVALLKINTTFNPSDLGTKGLSRARTLMLMCILRVWDEMHECFVGAQELKEEREAEFQTEHASASQHPCADHDFKECSSCNGGSEYVSGFKRLELWQRVGIVCGCVCPHV